MNNHKNSGQITKTRLYVVFTPIGNIEDISIRALNCLRASSLVVCETSRRTIKLLNHYEIKSKLMHINPHNEGDLAKHLINRCENNDDVITLVSDSGAPAVSDPGFKIIKEFISRGLKSEVIPGASAPFLALVGSGFDTNEVYFGSFLPLKSSRKRKALSFACELVKEKSVTSIFFESPYRIKKTLEILVEIYPECLVCIARELTKKFEEYLRGKPEELLKLVTEKKIKGEITILISK